ncbi:MAG: hypothetical protein OEZ20_00385 [candidate division WOR-3 bacterium]|nr:hypothetical protein [candidate division WOR-3 bacterium]MDH5682917.1 hypothetical protein [candidate division WOR-3 bacterium]
MSITIILIAIGAVALIWYIISTIRICEALRKRNIKVNYFLLRLYALKYVNQYKNITKKETGQVGPLFYHWTISIITVLFTAFILIFGKRI